MNRDHVKGAANQAKGSVKSAAGKLTGDSKLRAEGKAEKVGGKFQKAMGSVKDKLRGR